MTGLTAPLFVQAYDLSLYVLERTAAFPKQQRFVLARRVEDAALDLLEHVALALQSERQRRARVEAADQALTRLRLAWRLARDRNHLCERRYAHAATQIDEIGRMLGGYLKKLERQPDPA